MEEIVTAGEFLILTGIVLPLLPSEPVTTLTSITPRQAWLALVVVCSLSYASYLAQRYWAAAARGLWMAALGGLYSSTAETVVLARQAATGAVMRRQAQAGITLATAIMYLRILAVVAIFNLSLAREFAPACAVLSLAGLVICAVQYWLPDWAARHGPAGAASPTTTLQPSGGNPLELGPAALFAYDFVVLDIGDEQGAKERGEMLINRGGRLIGIANLQRAERPLRGQHPAGLEERRRDGRRRSALLMKTIRGIFVCLLLVSGAGLLGGCATDDPDSNISQLPWNQPQDWEGPMPSTLNQGR